MTLDQLTNLLVTITLFEMMTAVGFQVTLADLAAVGRDWSFVLRSMLANYVCVPVATVGLLILVDANPMVAAGFMILAVCPGAPFGPPLTALAKGNVPVAVGLMVVLAGSSAVLAPLLLSYLLSLLSSDQPLAVDAVKIVGTLVLTQLLPLCLGMTLREWRPELVKRLLPPANGLSKLLNLAVITLILSTQFQLLFQIRPRGFAAMLVLLIASWASGYVLGGPRSDQRKALMLSTALRNVGLALVIATGAFAGTPAVTGVVVYGLIEVAGSLILAGVLGRFSVEAPLPAKEARASDKAG